MTANTTHIHTHKYNIENIFGAVAVINTHANGGDEETQPTRQINYSKIKSMLSNKQTTSFNK